ncbi:MAG: T9SS type A sorting domain-containing protein [Crocinitomicaceae bacterium]|nr:T9SS type A sorting domain-containing protein [Crocinitomicaceae bacterium]MBK8926666.1 T9SS type A sorting domain-containing protein [Crocinitomicaceae bacterium]
MILSATGLNAQWNLISPSVGLDHSYKDVFFVNADTGFVVGGVQGEGAILRTTNGGIDWDTTTTFELVGSTFISLTSIYFPDDSVGYTIGSGRIFKTTNCGVDWFEIDTTNTFNSNANTDIIFVNVDTGFYGYTDFGSACFRTTDGGYTWFPDPILPGIRKFNCYNGNYFAGTSGWAFLDIATLTWQIFDNNITPYYHYVNTIIFNNRIFVIGDKMGGSSFGVLSYSDNLGLDWTTLYIDPGRLEEITLINDTLWQMCGEFNGTLRSIDGGNSWHYTDADNFETAMYKDFHEFCFVNDTVGYAVSQNGIYKTTNGGGASIGDAFFFPPDLGVSEFNISAIQIYPNPAQQEVTFTGVSTENSNLIMYSLDGKEVLHKQMQGEHNVDISDLESGIYLVKLVVDNTLYTAKFIKK